MLFVRGGEGIFMHSVYIPSGLALALHFKILVTFFLCTLSAFQLCGVFSFFFFLQIS